MTITEEATTESDAVPVRVVTDTVALRVVSADVKVRARLREMWRYRSLFLGLVRKELKVKYKSSVLGFLWSLLNPAFTLLIYWFVFTKVLGNGIQQFAIFLMAGLVVYNLFNYATMNATGAVVNNASIVKKVAFPREILALASVGAGLVFFFFQMVILVGTLVAMRYQPVLHALHYLPLVVPALFTLLVLCAALAVLLAALNVYLRDMQHLIEILVGAAWFWATPIVYAYSEVADKLTAHHIPSWILTLNPLTDIVLCFQRGIYAQPFGGLPAAARVSLKPGSNALTTAQLLPNVGDWWYLWHVLIALGFSAVLLFVALHVFGRLEGNFAEEL
ncbi:MAG: ABC transporter permease [Acidimicrobiales bacterium]